MDRHSGDGHRNLKPKTWVTSNGLIDVEPGHRGKTAINIKTDLDIEIEQLSLNSILTAKGFDEIPTPTLALIARQGGGMEESCVTRTGSDLLLRYPATSWPGLASTQAQPPKPTVRRTPAENLFHQLQTGQPSDNPLVNAWGFGSQNPTTPQPRSLRERLNIMQKREPAFCPACCCFDAGKVPLDKKKQRTANSKGHIFEYENVSDSPLMSGEYNIPKGHITRELCIKNTELEASAHGGCVFCRIIIQILGSYRKTWNTTDSFILLYLATDLPVTVRWTKGTRHTTRPLWEDSLEAVYKYDIDIHIPDPSQSMESDLEFEIYRPEQPHIVKRQGLYLSAITYPSLQANNLPGSLSYWSSHIGPARDLDSHPGSLSCFNFISSHATTCLTTHPNCGLRKAPLPDRVLHITPDNTGTIRLVEPNELRAQYIALSYCWGPTTPTTFLTTAATLPAMKKGFSVNELPRLFVGVVNVARMLGIAYVWIDRLCIIQGDEQDFATQAPKMGQYYGNATVSIAAASAESEHDDILAARDARWLSNSIDVQIEGLGDFELRFRERANTLGMEASGGSYGKMSSRAWIWQERLLAGRTVFFTPGGLKFECRQKAVWEGFSARTTAPSWSARLDKITDAGWFGLVEEFTKRDITRASDRLPAISSVMTRIARMHTAWKPVWGMWRRTLHVGLTWSVDSGGRYSGRHACRVHDGFYAPSWSWASIEGPVTYSNHEIYAAGDRKFDILDVDMETGVLKMVARARMVSVRCQIETMDGGKGEAGLSYYYDCMSVRERAAELDLGIPFGTPVRMDVALQPISLKAGRSDVEFISRVPYGQAIPRKTWESRCLCVLLSQQSSEWATVLLLGESQRVEGTYERIGLATGFPPSMFESDNWAEYLIC